MENLPYITILFSPHLVSPPWWKITLSVESFIYRVYDYKATYVFSKMYTKSQQYVCLMHLTGRTLLRQHSPPLLREPALLFRGPVRPGRAVADRRAES